MEEAQLGRIEEIGLLARRDAVERAHSPSQAGSESGQLPNPTLQLTALCSTSALNNTYQSVISICSALSFHSSDLQYSPG